MMEASAATPRVIEPDSGQRFPSLSEVWRHRDLVYYLARREVMAAYRQSVVGVFWAILQPLLLATVFSVFLGLLVKVPSQPGVPYPVFAVSGMVLWIFIQGALQNASESTVANEVLISKVYFPRLIIPLTSMFKPAFDFAFAFLVVVGAMLIYGVEFHLQIVVMPAVFLLTAATVFGAALWLSALNVKYRDIQQVVPFMILVGLFISPITYPFDLVSENLPENLQGLELVYALNPVVGLVEASRWALFGTADASAFVILIPIVASFALLVSGAAYFQRAERSFADVI
jgi:lipopolysaccharide transport system permease protein